MREFDVKIASVLLSQMALFGILAASALGQAPSPAPGQPSSQAAPQQQKESSPLYRITVSARTTKAINYRHLSGPTKIDFRGTILLPFAHGVAKVESKRGAVRIQAQFEKVDPATRFGPEFLTYVLWAISPEGRADNLGEVLLDNKGKSKLDVTAQLQAFALIVTAEPYFAVTRPSEVVVMENVVRPDTVGNVEEMDAKFDLLQRGQYSYVEASAQPPVLDPGTPLGLFEARNAVQIARAAGGEHYAEDSFRKAAQLLHQAEDMHKGKADKKQVEMTAREAVQTAEDARAITVKRRDEERVEMERRAAAEREAQARADAEAAQRAKLEAQLATERAARERAEAEAARAAAQAQAEQSRLAAEQSAREKVDADTARAAAQAQQLKAQAEAEQSRLAAERSAREKADAETAQRAAQAQQQAAEAETAQARKAAE